MAACWTSRIAWIDCRAGRQLDAGRKRERHRLVRTRLGGAQAIAMVQHAVDHVAGAPLSQSQQGDLVVAARSDPFAGGPQMLRDRAEPCRCLCRADRRPADATRAATGCRAGIRLRPARCRFAPRPRPGPCFGVYTNSSLSSNARAFSGAKVRYSDAPVCVFKLSITSVIRCASGKSSCTKRRTPSAQVGPLWSSATSVLRQSSDGMPLPAMITVRRHPRECRVRSRENSRATNRNQVSSSPAKHYDVRQRLNSKDLTLPAAFFMPNGGGTTRDDSDASS